VFCHAARSGSPLRLRALEPGRGFPLPGRLLPDSDAIDRAGATSIRRKSPSKCP